MTVDPFGDPVEARVGERAPQLDLTDPNYAGPVRIMSNESRTIYKGPAEPKLKILKRPEANSAAQQANRKQELQVGLFCFTCYACIFIATGIGIHGNKCSDRSMEVCNLAL